MSPHSGAAILRRIADIGESDVCDALGTESHPPKRQLRCFWWRFWYVFNMDIAQLTFAADYRVGKI